MLLAQQFKHNLKVFDERVCDKWLNTFYEFLFSKTLTPEVCRKQILELLQIALRSGSGSLSSSSSRPSPHPPLSFPLLAFCSSIFPPTPDTANSFPPPPFYLYPLFSFSFSLFFSSPFIILWVFCPSTHSFPLFNQSTPIQTFLCFSPFLPLPLPLSFDVSFKLLFRWSGRGHRRCLNYFIHQNGNLLNFESSRVLDPRAPSP